MTIAKIIDHLFPNCKYRLNGDYFPFTDPSFEVEIEYNGKWLEVLGCGVIQRQILENCGYDNTTSGWAFGLGLERLAMILFEIPDIRLFWSTDPKFVDQFAGGGIVKFKPFSLLDPIFQDISFWIPCDQMNAEHWIKTNDFYQLCREVAGDFIIDINCYDTFYHAKKSCHSKTFRLTFQPSNSEMDPAKFRDMVLEYQNKIRSETLNSLGVILR